MSKLNIRSGKWRLFMLWREERGVGLDADLSARTGPVATLLSDCIIMCLVGIRLIELRLLPS